MIDPTVHLSTSEQRARVDVRLCGQARPARNAISGKKGSRPMSTGQEVLFFVVCFSIVAPLQIVILNS